MIFLCLMKLFELNTLALVFGLALAIEEIEI